MHYDMNYENELSKIEDITNYSHNFPFDTYFPPQQFVFQCSLLLTFVSPEYLYVQSSSKICINTYLYTQN